MKNVSSVLRYMISILALLIICLYPNITYVIIKDLELTYIITSIIFTLPLLVIGMFMPRKWMYVVLVVILTMFSIIDLSMVDLFDGYLMAGGIISTIKTNPQEASEFYNANWREVFRWIPLLVCCVISCITYENIRNTRLKLIISGVMFLMPMVFIATKLVYSYRTELTLRFYLDNRVWNRTPYNVVYQSINAAKMLQKIKMIDNAQNFKFGAYRTNATQNKEVYILAIGESLRYDNVSLNGKYQRSTTPLLESKNNLILFHDYYSQACLTMYSVPYLITRATPENYDLNFQERSIIQPFKECGFKTYTIVNNTNLLSYEKYLSNGVDSIIIVPNIVKNGEIISGDKTMISVVDSLVDKHDKLFIVMQFMGNHSFFTNYEKEYDVFKPNANSCSELERLQSDSLLINAYDNSILYTDWIRAL